MKKQRVEGGFTLVELLTVTAVIAALAALLLPVAAQAKSSGHRTRCHSNLKQLTSAWFLYASDGDDRACPAYRYSPDYSVETAWDFTLDQGKASAGILHAYSRSKDLHCCPTFDGEGWGRPYTGYAYNTTYLGGDPSMGREPAALGEIADPVGTVLFADAAYGPSLAGHNYLRAPSDVLFRAGTAHFRHANGSNVTFADGHFRFMRDAFLVERHAPEVGALSAGDEVYDLD